MKYLNEIKIVLRNQRCLNHIVNVIWVKFAETTVFNILLLKSCLSQAI